MTTRRRKISESPTLKRCAKRSKKDLFMLSASKPRSEHTEQAVFVGLVRNFYPEVLIFAIPNGGLRDKRTAVKLKAEGVLAGVPDLMIAEPRATYSGLFVEMKRKGGRVSKAQVEVREKLEAKGYRVHVAQGSEEAFALFELYMLLPEPGDRRTLIEVT